MTDLLSVRASRVKYRVPKTPVSAVKKSVRLNRSSYRRRTFLPSLEAVLPGDGLVPELRSSTSPSINRARTEDTDVMKPSCRKRRFPQVAWWRNVATQKKLRLVTSFWCRRRLTKFVT